MRKVEFTVMSYREYEQLVSNLIGREYEDSIVDNEWNDGSWYACKVFAGDYDQSDIEQLNEFIETGKWLPSHHVIMSIMASRGIISPGNYLIEVYW